MVAAAPISSVWGEPARTPKEGDFQAFASFVAESDVVFLDGAVVVEKRPGYRVKVDGVKTRAFVFSAPQPFHQSVAQFHRPLAALAVPLMALSAALAVQSTTAPPTSPALLTSLPPSCMATPATIFVLPMAVL